MKLIAILTAATLCAVAGFAAAQDAPGVAPKPGTVYSPYPAQNFPDRVFFGDTHLHTAFSPDAGLIGATLTPDDAFRFARGQTVISSTGLPARLGRPLDFLVVSDHSENLGLPTAVANRDPQLLATEFGRKISEIMAPGTLESKFAGYEFWELASQTGKDPLAGSDFGKSMWLKATEAAERNNIPGQFTAFIGFEWTSTPDGNNLHRNVIFRGGKETADKIVPISAYDTEDPERLWDWMEKAEKTAGVRLLAIPHNGNLSNGLMFDDVTYTDRRPLDRAYAERRMRWEPIYEVTQMKGDSEAHPRLSPRDKFADFYTWDKGSFGPQPKTPGMLPREYAREAFKRGLAYQASLGANPFKFGLIGSTDSHTGLSTAEEDNYFGKIVALEPTADPIRFNEPLVGRFSAKDSDKTFAWQTAAAGIAAVWARENTRAGHLGRTRPQGGLRHDRHPDDGPGVRRLGIQDRGPGPFGLRQARLRAWCADGRRSAACAGRRQARLPDPRTARSGRRQPRSRAGDQGLACSRWHRPRAGLRRRLVGQSQAGQ